MMEYQDKQLLRKGNFLHLVRLKLIAVIALTVFWVLMGTCWLQVSSLSVHARSAASTSIIIGSRLAGSHILPPPLGSAQTITVYFSKTMAAGGPWGATFPLKRAEPVLNHVASVGDLASYAIQQLIAGPTKSELFAGYSSIVQHALFGRSTCAGQQNFILSVDEQGMQPKVGTVTIRLCRRISAAGVGVDAGIRAEIGSTLKQFPSLKNVVILTSDGHCFGDESGADFCLR